MHYPHEKREAVEFGRSPGNGITPMKLSRGPLATEGEATPGPDDYNPYEDRRREMPRMQSDTTPTAGSDPFVFDDVGGVVLDLEMPGLQDGPQF